MEAAYFEGEKAFVLAESTPILPSAGEVQLHIAYAGICGTDLHIFRGEMAHRVQLPQIMGHEVSATVSAIGEGVDGFSIGDPVAVMPLDTRNCDPRDVEYQYICEKLKVLGLDTTGGFQTYWTVPAFTLHHLPPQLSLAHGALTEPLAVACHAIRRSHLQTNDWVVVIGGGPIGLLVALVARHDGAQVMISEINPFRLQVARELGFETINPQESDLPQAVLEKTNGAGCDIVFEVTGSSASAEVITQLPRIQGQIIIVGIFRQPVPLDLFRIFWREMTLSSSRLYHEHDFGRAIQLMASDKLSLNTIITDIRPLHDIQVSFDQIDSGGDVVKILLDIGEGKNS